MAADHSAWPPTAVPLRFLRVPGIAWGVLAVLVLVGAAAFVMGLGADPERAWLSFHHNWLFWGSVSLGLVVVAIVFHLTNSRWSWSIRRFALAGAAFLPVAVLLYFVNWGGRNVYFHHWLGHIEGDPVLEAKAAFLSSTFMFVRDGLALLVLTAVALWFTYHMLRPDLHGLKGPRIYGWISGGEWRGARAEALRSRKIALRLGVVGALLFAFLWGLIAIDQAMTMLPHWFSTMFPVTFLVSSFHSALAMLAVMATLGRSRARLHDQITPGQYHDLGKLVFAYAVFWMYVNWSQYVVIWYGLLPHEQEFFVQRFKPPFGGLTEIAVGCIFVIPFFFLLSRPPKKVPAFLAFVSVIVLFGHWLERLLITVPSVWTRETMPLGLTEIGIALGFVGLFFLPYLWFLKTFPLLPSPAALAAIPAPTFVMPARTRTAEI
ncbi:MAG TPA: hypothetical protein VEW03_16060 [Longimicrobiaceae bacterium]|nr:hypothetical protein [Longimicrobiaceae bacterium]